MASQKINVCVCVAVAVAAVIVLTVITCALPALKPEYVAFDDVASWPVDSSRVIPHTLWVTGPYPFLKLPAPLKTALDTWSPLTPDVRWIDDTAAREFIRRHYPEYLPEYDVLIPTAFRADLWRLLVLLKHGGMYADCGVHWVCPARAKQRLWDKLAPADIVFVDDDNVMPGSVFQGVLAATPGHPLIQAAVKHVVTNIRDRLYGAHCLDITGPRAVGRAFADALGPGNCSAMKDRNGHWRLGAHRCKIGDHSFNVYILNYTKRSIYDATGTLVMKTKVPTYYSLMYHKHAKKPRPHYTLLWENRKVYKGV